MSKRSYRRLAVVAGAALAVGSMAPAMAAQVAANGTGSATVDLSDVTLPATGTFVSSASALIDDAEEFALESVLGGAQVLADATVAGLQNDVYNIDNIVDDLPGAASGLSVNANANANSGGATVSVGGSAVGGALPGLPDPTTGLSGVHGRLIPLVEFGTGTLEGALLLADEAKATVATTGSGVVLSGLNLVNNASVSVNAIAALMASL